VLAGDLFSETEPIDNFFDDEEKANVTKKAENDLGEQQWSALLRLPEQQGTLVVDRCLLLHATQLECCEQRPTPISVLAGDLFADTEPLDNFLTPEEKQAKLDAELNDLGDLFNSTDIEPISNFFDDVEKGEHATPRHARHEPLGHSSAPAAGAQLLAHTSAPRGASPQRVRRQACARARRGESRGVQGVHSRPGTCSIRACPHRSILHLQYSKRHCQRHPEGQHHQHHRQGRDRFSNPRGEETAGPGGSAHTVWPHCPGQHHAADTPAGLWAEAAAAAWCRLRARVQQQQQEKPAVCHCRRISLPPSMPLRAACCLCSSSWSVKQLTRRQSEVPALFSGSSSGGFGLQGCPRWLGRARPRTWCIHR